MKRIAIFASGEGTNADNIVRYFSSPDRDAEVSLIVTNRADAPVIGRAQRLGVECCLLPRDDFAGGEKVTELLESRRIDIVVLAGFLLMIPPALTERYRGRIVNIHPALLPRHGGKGMYGMRVHEAVLTAGDTETGITIHHVNERYDDGAIIFQTSVPVEPTDTAPDIARKVRRLEELHFAPVIEQTFCK